MSAKIIMFDSIHKNVSSVRTTQAQIDLNRSSINSSLAKNYNTVSFPKITQLDFLKNMETRRSDFMFPSILAGYRKGINPVDALYNTLQKILFNYNKNDKMCIWLIGLFKDSAWVNKLCSALIQDCNTILSITQYEYNSTLIRIYNNFLHYINVFREISIR